MTMQIADTPRNGPSSSQLLVSLLSDLCPVCGGPKSPGKTMCFTRCWRRLPKRIRVLLYRRIGDGYEQAFAGAMEFLNVAEPKFPPTREPMRGPARERRDH